ncbi:hypothetical protein ACJMK2_020986 [Sinanodonta woodiana]|uniref:SLC26A/SulP transporter domain-containing protein n=1 Tax=Sinanodonta woodiana TaxID=1069815 RepID=A0ABD3U0R9_SINWO
MKWKVLRDLLEIHSTFMYSIILIVLQVKSNLEMSQQRSFSVVDGMPMAPTSVVTKNKTRRFSCPPVNAVEMSVNIKRAPLTQVAFDELHLKSEQESTSWKEKLKSQCFCSKHRLWKIMTAYFPIIKVMRYYKFRDNLLNDFLSGVTIGILHIPQALAFGQLTSVKVEGGLYTSVWPVLLYVFFGTSAHVSMGTSAVISIVTAAVVDREADTFKLNNMHLLNSTGNGTNSVVWESISEFMDFKEGVSMNISFFTGIILLAMGLARLGFITAYLSDSFFSAFTSGAGVHIAISQLPAMLGLKIPRFGGNYKIFKTCAAIFGSITEVNVAALLIGVISGIIILFVKDCINERFKSKLVIPIPIELFIVVGTTLVSYLGSMKQTFNLDIVEYIPQTIPPPQLPNMVGVENYIVDCFVMAILVFANTIAMAKICAKRHNYELDDSQELIAYGMCNFGSSFFRCFPSAVAPPRSMVASSMNTKTTLSGVFSTALMLLLILVLSPLFECLPRSALATIIVVALKGLFIQINISVKYWKVNKIDFVIWFFTFFSVVFLDIDFGLGIGVGVALITVVFQTQFAKGYRVGRTIKDTALVEHKKYTDAMEIPGIKIFRFHSNLYFANAEIFRTALYKSTVNPRKILKYLKKMEKKKAKEEKERKVSRDSSVQYDNKNGNGISIIENSVKIDVNDQDTTMNGTNDNGNSKIISTPG